MNIPHVPQMIDSLLAKCKADFSQDMHELLLWPSLSVLLKWSSMACMHSECCDSYPANGHATCCNRGSMSKAKAKSYDCDHCADITLPHSGVCACSGLPGPCTHCCCGGKSGNMRPFHYLM